MRAYPSQVLWACLFGGIHRSWYQLVVTKRVTSREHTGWFLSASVLGLLVSLVAHRVAGGDLSLVERCRSYFPAGPAELGLQIVGGLFVVAVALTLIDWFVRSFGAGVSRDYGGIGGLSVEETLREVARRVLDCTSQREPNVSGAMDELLRGALRLNASDIHLNPLTEVMKVTFRVDGVLHDVVSVSPSLGLRFTARVKVLSRLDSYAKEPQDGSMRRAVGGTEVEARVSTLPANHGERVVLRLVRGNEGVPAVTELGFEHDVSQKLEHALLRPQGIFYVSGPVGSGKTTTLYSALAHLHRARGETTSLVTLEDPIELQLPFATQTQINAKLGMSFAQTLRSVLRQDPGALMVGEIRDRETAEIATQAGLTGHLILTTIHVQSAAGTFARLVDMGVDPFALSSSCLGSLAQRLVRGLCVECRVEQPVETAVKERFSHIGVKLPPGKYFEPVGCPSCNGRGYLGRLPIAEILVASDSIREAIHRQATTEEIHRLSIAEGMTPLVWSGLSLAMRGETSLQEVLRVAG